jgi:uncharacterized coiled-coil protein SlyX
MKRMDHRIEDLETKLAHLELAFDELNQAVYKQAKQLELAQRLVENLRSRVKDMVEQSDGQPYSAENERPPHY